VAVRERSRANPRPALLLKAGGQSIELGIGKKWHMVQAPWQGRLGVMRSSAKPHMGCFHPPLTNGAGAVPGHPRTEAVTYCRRWLGWCPSGEAASGHCPLPPPRYQCRGNRRGAVASNSPLLRVAGRTGLPEPHSALASGRGRTKRARAPVVAVVVFCSVTLSAHPREWSCRI
jgi:hypothetical protein